MRFSTMYVVHPISASAKRFQNFSKGSIARTSGIVKISPQSAQSANSQRTGS